MTFGLGKIGLIAHLVLRLFPIKKSGFEPGAIGVSVLNVKPRN